MANTNTVSGDSTNDANSRFISRTAQGFSHRPPKATVFGEVEEIGGRVGGTFHTLSDSTPSNFRQLGPASGGGNANNARPKSYSGNMKFGSGRRYA